MAALLFLVFLFLAKATWNIHGKEQESNRQLELLKQEYSDLQSRNDYLNSEISHLSTSTGLDVEIRQKFGVTREGEMEIVLVEPQDSGLTQASSAKPSLWQRILNFFK